MAWLAPLPRLRRNIFCVGKNYDEHAMEFARSGFDSASDPGQDIPEHPIIFTKAAETVIGPRASIEIPTGLTSQVDYEAELAVVIGTSGRFIPRRRALDYVFGFTMINDITARDLQKRHKQWFLGKSIETFCPMGPFIRTIDQIDLDDLILEGHVNGELRQSAPESAMIFDISSIISTISQSMMLLPGDVIATGTPAGVGIGRSPPVFLKGGDSVSVSATGLGTLTDPVVGLS
ncbi:MAG: fumarylacetoacetate hydrolase family protein [Pseudomonadota bacterium]